MIVCHLYGYPISSEQPLYMRGISSIVRPASPRLMPSPPFPAFLATTAKARLSQLSLNSTLAWKRAIWGNMCQEINYLAEVVVETSLLGGGATVSEFLASRDQGQQEPGLVLAHAVVWVLFQPRGLQCNAHSGPPANSVSYLTYFNKLLLCLN